MHYLADLRVRFEVADDSEARLVAEALGVVAKEISLTVGGIPQVIQQFPTTIRVQTVDGVRVLWDRPLDR